MELVGHYVDGSLRTGEPRTATPVENPATEETLATCANAGPALVEEAVTAARRAGPGWAAVPLQERLDYLSRWRDAIDGESDALVDTVVDELGVTPTFARNIHLGRSVRTPDEVARAATHLLAPRNEANSVVVREPAGVVAAITAWNFGMHMFVSKVASALAVGCTVVVKPSEVKPLAAWKAALLLAEVGLPPGVVNVVNGTGADTGLPLVSHPEVDMVGLTGSRDTGKRVLEATAGNITRCVLELGGKSAAVILPGAPLQDAIAGIIGSCFFNNGQVCGAQTRLLVLRDDLEEVGKMVSAAVDDVVVGDPRADGTRLGPVVSRRQHERVSGFIAEGVDGGLDLLTGGPGRPPQLPRGYYVRPTVFTDVPSTHHLAQEEIFGPVLCLIAGDSIDDLAAIANDSRYGLAGAVWAATTDEAVTFARRLRTGQVQINGGAFNLAAPYGGFKQSGIGREHGLEGLAEYTELKSMQLPA